MSTNWKNIIHYKGRPLTGVIRPATQSAISQSVEQTLRTPRTAMTARPITASSSRSVRYTNYCRLILAFILV